MNHFKYIEFIKKDKKISEKLSKLSKIYLDNDGEFNKINKWIREVNKDCNKQIPKLKNNDKNKLNIFVEGVLKAFKNDEKTLLKILSKY